MVMHFDDIINTHVDIQHSIASDFTMSFLAMGHNHGASFGECDIN